MVPLVSILTAEVTSRFVFYVHRTVDAYHGACYCNFHALLGTGNFERQYGKADYKDAGNKAFIDVTIP